MAICFSCGQDNPDPFRFCGACGAELAVRPVPSRDVRKTVTVLFCDLVGYTSTSEGLDPEALRRLQSRYFEGARSAVERHGGTVEKFIGDAVMAVFGIPQLHEDDALRAIKAALELRQAVAELELQARIGVNTGEVVAGSGDALVTGDAVNTAARLEQAAPLGDILISEHTLRLCRDAAVVEAVEPLVLKGKVEAVPAYRLLGVREGVPDYGRGHDTAMVGRTRELALLRQAFDRSISERSCHLFTVLGSAGIGKSRLVAEFVTEVGGEAKVWTGRCLSYGEGITYWPMREVFRQALAEDEFERALALPSPEEAAWAVRTFFEQRAREYPLVLVLDDLHWAESTYLDLVEHVADLSRDAPILLLCMARPELLDARPAWGGGKLNATSVLLEALTAAESEQLVAELAGDRLSAEGVRRIVEATEGNPLFVAEMLAVVGEEDGDGRGGLEVPSTIQALLASRLEHLQPGERRILELAAVEGKGFHRSAVAELAPPELRPDVSAHLVALVRKDLIRPDETELPGEDAFRFRHQLIRDAAYHALPKELRADLHERFAAWLKDAPGQPTSQLDEIVGYHLEQAASCAAEVGGVDGAVRTSAGRAADFLARAGGRAFERNDMPAAANLLGRAAALLEPGDPKRASILPELGTALGTVGELARADDVLAHAVEEARALGDDGLEARAVAERILLQMVIDPEGRAQEARAEGERLITKLEGSQDDRALAKAWYMIGQADLMAARFADMARAMSTSLEHADRAGDLQQQAEAINWLAVATSSSPSPIAEGIPRLERLRDRVAPGSEAEGGLLVNLAKLQGIAGRTDDARRLASRGRAIFAELGMKVMWAAYGMEEATISFNAADPAAAEPGLREACDVLQRMGERGFLSSASAMLAQALYAREQLEDAERWTRVSEGAAAPDDLESQVVWRGARAKILARRGELEEGERLAREAVALVETSDDLSFIGDAVSDLAEVLRLAGNVDGQRSCLERALELYERKGVVRLAERSRGLLAELAPEH